MKRKFILPLVAVFAISMTSCSEGECNVDDAESAAKCFCEVKKEKDKDKKGKLKERIQKKIDDGTYTENELEEKLREVCK